MTEESSEMGKRRNQSRCLNECIGQTGWPNRNLFFHSSGGWKSTVKVPVGLVFPEASLLVLQTATFSLSSHGPSICTPLGSLPLLVRAPVLLGKGPPSDPIES